MDNWRMPDGSRIPMDFIFRCSGKFELLDRMLRKLVTFGPSRAQSASLSLRRALLTPQVNPGSRYRCGKRT